MRFGGGQLWDALNVVPFAALGVASVPDSGSVEVTIALLVPQIRQLAQGVPLSQSGASPAWSGIMVSMEKATVSLLQVVLDCTNARGLAEFYRQLLGYQYRPGDDAPPAGEADPNGQDWLVLRNPAGGCQIAFQQVDDLPEATWPRGPYPQMAHLDLTVPTVTELDAEHGRALALGARLLRDRSDDIEEPLRVYADPAGHPFCIFVADPSLA